ncbi:MAG: hypothetical protein H6857_04585 [Rhodospirillales bacterium]|nr:hypothetical protein [Rhodospirillales bacterium]
MAHHSLSCWLCGAFCAAILLILPFQGQAGDKVNSLTESNIRAFIEEMTDLATGAKSGKNVDDTSFFFMTHLHPNAFFKSAVKYKIPGYPDQENVLRFDRAQYIESLTDSGSAVSNFAASVQILSIKISKDKKKATVKTVSEESGDVHVPQSGGTSDVPMQGRSVCDQILMLSSEKIIQLYGATCKTDMSFEDF